MRHIIGFLVLHFTVLGAAGGEPPAPGPIPAALFTVSEQALGPLAGEVLNLDASPDGRHWACSVQRRGDKRSWVIDGKPGPEFDGGLTGMTFSYDGSRSAYVAVVGKIRPDMKAFAVVDGRPRPEDDIYQIDLMPDGNRFHFIGRKDGGKTAIFFDDQPGPTFDGDIHEVVFSPDGNHVAYLVFRGSKRLVIVDGKAGPEYDKAERPAFCAGNRVAYPACSAGKWFIVTDGKPGQELGYDLVGCLVYGPDGQRSAYIAYKGDRAFVVVDGQPQSQYMGVGRLSFSPDGKHLAHVALLEGKGYFIVVDGKPHASYSQVGDPFFSQDSKHLAYVAWDTTSKDPKGNQWFVVLDGQPGPRFNYIEWRGRPGRLTFSPDGKHIAYRVAEQDGSSPRVVVDGEPGPTYERISNDGVPTFYADGSVGYFAVKSKTLYFVRHVPAAR